VKEDTFHQSRWLAAASVAALLLSFTVGFVWHHHDSHSGPVCSVCQTLHMPALAFSAPVHVQTPAVLGTLVALPAAGTPRDSVIVHRPSRAPPLA
jgi:hypothetical protein